MKWIGTGASLALAGAWIWSEARPLNWTSPKGSVQVMWCWGRVIVGYRVDTTVRQPSPGWCPLAGSMPPAWWFNWYGGGGGASTPFVMVPFWPLLLVALAAAAPAWRFDALARRRARAGRCPKCGYDRHGLDGASPCPECGAVPAGDTLKA